MMTMMTFNQFDECNPGGIIPAEKLIKLFTACEPKPLANPPKPSTLVLGAGGDFDPKEDLLNEIFSKEIGVRVKKL